MKKMIAANCLLALTIINCNGQENDSNVAVTKNTDSLYFDKKLPVYEANPCLFMLITAVAKSNEKFYSPQKYFYSLTFEKTEKYRYMNISPEQWLKAKNIDYKGVLRVKNITFLCRGDFEKDSIFHKKTTDEIRIKIKPAKDTAEVESFFIEPSLDGAFYDCKGLPIYVEVYTQGQIPGYQRKVIKEQ